MNKKKYVIDKKYLEVNIETLDFKDRMIIFSPESRKEEFRKPKDLLYRAYDGAGCRPTSIGTAVFVEGIYDKDKFRDCRWNVLNVVKKEFEEEVIKKYLQAN